MNTPQPLPAYSDATLAACTTDQLLELLARDEDRVPRNVIDECARRGDAIVQHLGLVLENHRWDGEASHGEWWRLLHAVMILGLVPTEAAARDETEDWDFRMFTANTLLDFPRPQYRGLLDALAKRQPKLGTFFREKDVAKAYAEAQDKPEWKQRRQDPWSFYEPQAIAARQERWAKEDQEEHEREERRQKEGASFEDVIDPYVRPEPRIGRNDPCPCGSGSAKAFGCGLMLVRRI